MQQKEIQDNQNGHPTEWEKVFIQYITDKV